MSRIYLSALIAVFAGLFTIIGAVADWDWFFVVPVGHSLDYAQKYKTELHICAGDHRLNDQLPFIIPIFADFLDRVLA